MSIAVQWVVFSELSTDAMVATGITDEPSTARWMVETILADTSHAGWGEVRRVPVPRRDPQRGGAEPVAHAGRGVRVPAVGPRVRLARAVLRPADRGRGRVLGTAPG